MLLRIAGNSFLLIGSRAHALHSRSDNTELALPDLALAWQSHFAFQRASTGTSSDAPARSAARIAATPASLRKRISEFTFSYHM